MSRMIATLATAVIANIFFALPAAADDQSYLDYLQVHNINIYAWSKHAQLWNGHKVCDDIHAGVHPAEIVDRLTHDWVDGGAIVSAAQRELCPDTLS